MKRILFVLTCLCACFPLGAQQDSHSQHALSSFQPDMSVSEYRRMKFAKVWEDFPKFEIRLGYSGFPITDIINYAFDEFGEAFGPGNGRPDGLEGIYAPYEGDAYMTGNIGAEFSWHIEKWFTLAGGLYFNALWSTMVDPSDGHAVERKGGVTVSFTPVARFYWANFEKCRLYSSVGLGLSGSFYGDSSYMIPAFQLSPFGITAGRKVFFFAEYSVGTVCLGAQAGIGYRF